MQNFLIFDKNITGHNLEYIHHLYIEASKDKQRRFVFAVPKEFEDIKNKLEWPDADNTKFHFLSNINHRHKQQIFSFFSDIKTLNQLIKKYGIHKILFINWISPFVFLFINQSVRISGINYNIYLYGWHKKSIIEKIKTTIKNIVFIQSRVVENILILNDRASTRYLNCLFHTNKFKLLPDPFFLPKYTPKNIRTELGISKSKKIFLLFGTLSERKGTLEVIQSISILTQKEKEQYHFIFAGRINANVKNEFYNIYNKIKNKSPITLFDEFCSYELLNDLCFTCDIILVPYKQTAMSSGVIGYAAHYKKPIIGAKDGLIGKLIKHYQLGTLLEKIEPLELTKKYLIDFSCGKKSAEYEKDNNIFAFTKIALS